jgi:hypothetical protein
VIREDILPELPPPNVVTWVIEAPTIEEAVDQCECIERYGVTPQGVLYYVLQKPAPGILGFGKRPARIEAWAPITSQPFSYLRGFDPPEERFRIATTEAAYEPEHVFGTMGVRVAQALDDDPDPKVTAFEVWINDPTDNRRQSIILMSEYAYNDDAIYKYLALKGKTLPARPGSSTHLITRSLVLVVDVSTVKYSRDADIPESYFESVIFQLSAFEAYEEEE